MATLRRVRVVWNGLGALPGVSTFYTDAADDVTTDLATFFTAISTWYPSGLSWTIPAAGDEISDATGQLVGAWTGGTAATVNGGTNSAYAAGTGMYINWVTGIIRASHKFQGRTFLCPLTGGAYQADGTIATTVLSTHQTAANTLVATGKLRIFGRPFPGNPTSGTSGAVTGALIPDQVTSLRSRRR